VACVLWAAHQSYDTTWSTSRRYYADTPQFVATLHDTLVLLPPATTPTSTSPNPKPTPQKSLKALSKPLPSDDEQSAPTRFNDGGCDAAGRMFYGSMTLPSKKDGGRRGELWRYVS
jgi:sugar lactone lactonase YvrE